MVPRSLPASRSRNGWLFSSVVAVALAALVPGCGDGDTVIPSEVPPANQNQDPPQMMMTDPPLIEDLTRDYYRDAKPLLERYCTTCHSAGGLAPFALTD